MGMLGNFTLAWVVSTLLGMIDYAMIQNHADIYLILCVTMFSLIVTLLLCIGILGRHHR